MNECPHCNTHNPPQAVTCRVCNLNVPRSNPSPLTAGRALPKLAVFDLDNTLFDLSRRERAAKRQGLKPKGKGWYEFLHQNQYVLMDTAIPGTVPFIKSLSDGGYTIAYLSGRPSSILAATKQSLQESGFPIDATDRDLVFLHSGNQPSLGNLTNHKKAVLTHLKSMFDVDYFFDDTPEFREAAKSLFIPGVYSSISSYTGKEERPSAPKKTKSKKPRNNPSELRCPEHGMVNYDEIETIEQGAVHPFTGEAVTSPVLIHKGCGLDIKAHGNVRANPAPKPRKKRNKAGNMIKEPVKKYMSRFMGDSEMNKKFPINTQRFAVGLNYAREFYGDSIVDKHFPRKPMSNPIGPFKKKEKPSEAVLQGVMLYREMWEAEEEERKQDAEYDSENFTPRTLTAIDGWDDDFGKEFNPNAVTVDWSYMEQLFPLAKYLEGTLSINYYDIDGIKLKDFDTLKEAVNSYEIRMKELYAKDPKGYPGLKDTHYYDYDDVNEGFAEGHPRDRTNYMVTFTKRNSKRFQKLLDDPQRVSPKPKPVKPTPAIEKKIVAWYKAYHEAKNADDYENKSFLLTVYIDFGKYMRSEQSPMTLAQYSNNGYEAVKGMFAVLKGVGYTPEWMNTHEGEPVTWAKFMKQGTLTSNGKKSWNFIDAHLTVDTDQEYALRTKIEGYNKLMGYLQYLADEDKINGILTPSGFQFNFNEVKDNPRSNPSHEITISEILEQLEGVEEQLSDVEAEIAEARRDIENTDTGSSLEAVNYKMLDAWAEIQSNLQDTQASLKDMADWAAGSPEKHPDYRANPRSNPHSPVTEAKEMYEQFHKKAPSSVKKQKVEIGDTWVGLGKAWSIGYRSGKETGNETQKYIHNFGVDEESGKKFKEPELYYVKNKDGSQMMVIMGGDWYIDVDADGEVSWIYV